MLWAVHRCSPQPAPPTKGSNCPFSKNRTGHLVQFEPQGRASPGIGLDMVREAKEKLWEEKGTKEGWKQILS